MIMTPQSRKLALTAHVVFSVSWIGAVCAYLALALIGVANERPEWIRAACLAMDAIGWLVIVPCSFASLLTGVILGVGTPWGLVRHYWISIKLLMTLASTVVLLLHMQLTHELAVVALRRMPADPGLHGMQVQLVADAGAALLVLLVMTALSVYKPRGLTRFGLA